MITTTVPAATDRSATTTASPGSSQVLPAWFDPRQVLPSTPLPTVRYDVRTVRRHLGRSGIAPARFLVDEVVRDLWAPDLQVRTWWHAPGHAHIDADLRLDPTALAFAVQGPGFEILEGRNTALDPYDVVQRRAEWIRAVHRAGIVMTVAHHSTGGVPAMACRTTPDASIECVYERAFGFAARAIAGGVDDVVARTWAHSIIVAHGLPRPPWTLASARACDPGDSHGLYPPQTHLVGFYERALEDLRVRGDGTRFMTLAARVAAESYS
ncbi:hypothetical protein [Demequina flava]|uniref:hypothetical protein n=1 Tax=Demequina flava TaxID=1095025 RepID=UPI000784F2D6|nr:hypothetical protein [Demequina flava]